MMNVCQVVFLYIYVHLIGFKALLSADKVAFHTAKNSTLCHKKKIIFWTEKELYRIHWDSTLIYCAYNNKDPSKILNALRFLFTVKLFKCARYIWIKYLYILYCILSHSYENLYYTFNIIRNQNHYMHSWMVEVFAGRHIIEKVLCWAIAINVHSRFIMLHCTQHQPLYHKWFSKWDKFGG